MTVQPGITKTRVASVRSAAPGPSRTPDAVPSHLLAEVAARLPADGPRFCASAPGRLDVIGGSAEYAGSLIVNKPIARQACVAVQRRTDGKLCLVRPREADGDGRDAPLIAMASLNGSTSSAAAPDRADSLLGDGSDDAARCALGTVAAVWHDFPDAVRESGLSIAYGTALSSLTDAGAAAAVAAATLVAVAAAYELTLDSTTAAAICQRVENDWLGVPVGIGDALCALSGVSNGLGQNYGEPASLNSGLRLPHEVTLLGIDTGARHPGAAEKYAHVRAASFMGRTLIDRIVRHEGAKSFTWDGAVARVPIAAYVECFRDRLPTKLKGCEYLNLFGTLDDPLTTVDPSVIYRIRSRTEHHIYEHARAVQFVECLRRLTPPTIDPVLRQAGELMYASHWSYGQRCGLGSVETDLLVNLVRQYGREADVYGAKISGRGCGGVVTVLMGASDRAREAVDAAIEAYATRTGRTPTLVSGSSDGALVTGARHL